MARFSSYFSMIPGSPSHLNWGGILLLLSLWSENQALAQRAFIPENHGSKILLFDATTTETRPIVLVYPQAPSAVSKAPVLLQDRKKSRTVIERHLMLDQANQDREK